MSGRRFLAEHHRIEKGEFIRAIRQTVEWPSIEARSRIATWTRMFIAGLVAEQIVDRLEAVEIDDADGKGRRVVGTVADQALDLVEEAAMIA